jgi:N-succinyldiaminopimelate aminotransferase
MLGLVNPGDEVVLVEPFYDSYAACVAMAGGTVRPIRLRAPDFSFPLEELRHVVGPRTKAILINSPHNPLGRVFTRSELEGIAAIARAADCLVLSDEVYEEIWFGEPPVSISTLPGMRERTVVMSSLGKTFSLTGWKIGWTIAPANLTAGIRAAHQFLTFCSATPLQRAAVDALQAPRSYYEGLRADYLMRRDAMLGVLRDAGFDPYVPDGSYFVVSEHAKFGFASDFAFALHLVEKVGVACIPCSAFYAPQADGSKDAEASSLVRFAFCKSDETIRDAAVRLRTLGQSA